ncbi:MAG: helix-turn-helix transcriptional regulator [Eubacteriales bacterium]|nr:helix-turn-helix transcriptional regulator [Eubacteriales bacterium]
MQEITTLSKCVQHHRHLMQESQEVFAEKCGLSSEMISLIERQMVNPTLNSISRISKHIGLSVSEIFAFDIDNI